jgi:hypothetical protein
MVATTAYGYDLELALGIGRQASAGVWDAGRWDTAVWAQPDTALGDWVDVTCDVVAPFQLAAGTSEDQGVATRWEAASCAFTLAGPDWDPWGGPYADLLGPQIAVRWRWRLTGDPTWLPLFYGATVDAGWDWDPRTQTAQVTASDSTADLATFMGAQQAPVGAGETAAARVTRWLDYARWPADRRAITTGGVHLVATDMAGKAWEQLLTVADTDVALLFVDRAGRLVYKPTGRTTVQVITGALVACPTPAFPAGVQVVDMGRGAPAPVVNMVSVRGGTPPGGTDPPYQNAVDEGSVTRYRAHRAGYDLEHDTATHPGWSLTVAQLVVAAQAWPSAAPHELTLGLISGDTRVPGVLFSLDPGQAFQVVDPGGRVWLEQIAGWDVQIGWDTCAGQLYVTDVTRWAGAWWDTATWDHARWAL